MKNRQLSLSDIQKDYISKEEFYQIAHICKETALWLIETGRVSAEKPKRKGFGYKIAKEEVERYLADRQQNPLYYLKGKRHNCIPYTPPQPYSSELGGAIQVGCGAGNVLSAGSADRKAGMRDFGISPKADIRLETFWEIDCSEMF